MNIEPLESRITPATFIVTALTDAMVDDGVLTLREAITAANATSAADKIKFDPALDGVITLTGGEIAITEKLTILGGGKIAISGNHGSRIFNVSNPDTVKDHPLLVNGLKFIEGNSNMTGSGGAIRSSEGLTVINCLFADNVSTSHGGAISVDTETGSLKIKHSHFSDNLASGYGGGIDASVTKAIRISGSAFGGNTAGSGVGGDGGGASLDLSDARGRIVVQGTHFVGNETLNGNSDGGGLAIDGDVSGGKYSRVAIVNSTFLDNDSTGAGGGQRLADGAFTLSAVKISGNEADGAGGGLAASGEVRVAVSKTVIEGNSTPSSAGGGGLHFTNTAPGFSAKISNTEIIGNDATGGRGGGIRALNTGGRITITGSLISGNEAAGQGGGIMLQQDNPADLIVRLTGNTVSGNEAGGSGGGIELHRHGDFILTRNVIAGNHAGGGGGGVQLDMAGQVALKTNQIVGNRAGNGTGGIDLVADNDSTVRNSGNVIAHNEGSQTGGLSILSSVPVTIAKNTKITGNIAGSGSAGGGVTNSSGEVKLLGTVLGNYNRVNPAFNQVHGTFASGPAPGPGTAGNLTVTNLDDSGPGSLRNAIAQANAAPGADKIKFAPTLAGLITLTGGEIDITGKLSILGGGRVVISGNGASRILLVSDNTADNQPLTVNGLAFVRGNSFSGSAIFSNEGLKLVNCLFVDNDATSLGGAVAVDGGNAPVKIKNSHFSDNTGGAGGSLWARSGTAIGVIGSVFDGNTGSRGGGAELQVLPVTAKITVRDSIFSRNDATAAVTGVGGGLALTGQTIGGKATKAAIVHSSFFGNTANVGGGGLDLAGGAFTLTGLNLSGNSATGEGGGLRTGLNVLKLAVSKSLIAGNSTTSATGGGGVYLGPGALDFAPAFFATEFLGNSAANGSGGGLLVRGTAGKVAVAGSLIANNLAKTGGGLAMLDPTGDASRLVLTGNTVAGNEAQTGGGLWTDGDGALALTRNAIVGNHATLGGGGASLEASGRIILKTNSVLANHADSGVGGLFLSGPGSASFKAAGGIIAFNAGTSTGGLHIGGALSGNIAKSVKITGNIGEGAIYGGGVTQESTGSVELLATVLGNHNRTHSARDETFGIFAP